MIEVKEMERPDIEELVSRVGYGHLACSEDRQPYVIPIHYAYIKPDILVYTTCGKKTEIIDANPKVCLQIEEVVDNSDWRSVMVFGEAGQVTGPKDRRDALNSILASNPTLTPAISIRWMDNWVRENREVIYRIRPHRITGRFSVKVNTKAAFAPSTGARPGRVY
jgi:nitroimidazol reductase NimA-like FMN-containing flavoprotein (pyridoxamine 5'-phosphate oxidase superfamily)